MNLPQISEEQKKIIDKLKDHNIIVDSVAGSGKTTTNLYIGKEFSNSNILLLTYNSKLKLETRQKADTLGLNNMEVHSYHSFCVKYYMRQCFTDSEIKIITDNDTQPYKDINYDIILLDEAQDITFLYYTLICKIFKDNINNDTKVCLLGDKYQSIYDFNNADDRYITFGNELFSFNNYNWEKFSLSTSFRVNKNTAKFINKCMLGMDRINGFHDSLYKPKYIICDVFQTRQQYKSKYLPFDEVYTLLNIGYKPDDIFILAPSLKSIQCPARVLENYLKMKCPDIPLYVPSSDEEKIDEEIIKNKIIFSTFHQAKGMERKVAIVFGFDNTYFKYYKQNQDPSVCPNELYVATTRGKERLIMLHHQQNGYLPFLNLKRLKKYAICSGEVLNTNSRDTIQNNIPIQVTNIIKHLQQDVTDNCLKFITIQKVRPIGEKIIIPHKIENKQNNLYESISEINGIAIPFYFGYVKKNNTDILNYCINPDQYMIKKGSHNIKKFWENNYPKLQYIKKNNLIKDNLLYISTFYNSLNSQYLFKSYQITDFNWLTDDMLNNCNNRMNSLNLTDNFKTEVICTAANNKENDYPELYNRQIVGRYDCLDTNILYEFKCTEKLEKEHYLQLAIYMYVHKLTNQINNHPQNFRYMLYNILTDELNEITSELDDLKKMIAYLFYNKFYKTYKFSDQEFKNNALSALSKYFECIKTPETSEIEPITNTNEPIIIPEPIINPEPIITPEPNTLTPINTPEINISDSTPKNNIKTRKRISKPRKIKIDTTIISEIKSKSKYVRKNKPV